MENKIIENQKKIVELIENQGKSIKLLAQGMAQLQERVKELETQKDFI